MQTGNRKQIFNEINITPLTDIFLVLLIIMMVVAPLMQQTRQDIQPPELSNGDAVEQNKLTVEITKDGAIYVMGKETNFDKLSTTLKEQQDLLLAKASGEVSQSASGMPDPAEPAERNVIIRADKATKSGQVYKIFEAARDAGFTKATVAGEALSVARQGELQQQQGAGPMSDASLSGGPTLEGEAQ